MSRDFDWDPDVCCGKCKYHQHEHGGDGWICINDRSEGYGDYTEYRETCDEFERREEA